MTAPGARWLASELDAELAAVVIALAPLGERARRYVDVNDRTFDYEGIRKVPWSSGERQLVEVAGALWNRGAPDLSYIACAMGGEFFDAIVNAIAARRGADFRTDYAPAVARARWAR